MSAFPLTRLAIAAAISAVSFSAQAAPVVSFAGYDWEVRTYGGGPGPNTWDAANVFVDGAGLHLRIAQVNGVWSCAEVIMTGALGFGTYRFDVTSRPDRFDRNVVLGLFNYPASPAVGPDGSNEIDIEFAQWGDAGNKNRLNWTVHPPALGPEPTHHAVPISLKGDTTTHRFDWTASGVRYAAFRGDPDAGTRIAEWNDAPKNPATRIPQVPLVVHMNLWLFNGEPPADGQPVEVVIRSFSFTPH